MNDLKRIEAKVDINELTLWKHHCKNAGIKTNQSALNEAIKLHTEFLLSGKKPTFLIEEALDVGDDDTRNAAISHMAELLKSPLGNFIIEPSGRTRIVNLAAFDNELRAGLAMIVFILLLAIIGVFWFN